MAQVLMISTCLFCPQWCSNGASPVVLKDLVDESGNTLVDESGNTLEG